MFCIFLSSVMSAPFSLHSSSFIHSYSSLLPMFIIFILFSSLFNIFLFDISYSILFSFLNLGVQLVLHCFIRSINDLFPLFHILNSVSVSSTLLVMHTANSLIKINASYKSRMKDSKKREMKQE